MDLHLTLVHAVSELFATGPTAAFFPRQGGLRESVQRAAAACLSCFKVITERVLCFLHFSLLVAKGKKVLPQTISSI